MKPQDEPKYKGEPAKAAKPVDYTDVDLDIDQLMIDYGGSE